MTGRSGPTDQELALRDRSVRDWFGRSLFHRKRLLRAGFSRQGVRHFEELRRLPPFHLDDVANISDLLTSARPSSRERREYWPLQWVMTGDLPLAYSAEDLGLLGDLGRDVLEAAGLRTSDVMANVLPAGTRDQLQIQLGAQVGGLSSLAFGTGALLDHVLAISPNVIAGEVKELNKLLDAAFVDDVSLLADVHTFFVVGPMPSQPRMYKKLQEHVAETQGKIVRAWSPPGVFGLWAQCRGGEMFHMWPQTEYVEIVDPLTGLPVPEGASGMVLYTAFEWYATSMLRLQTDALASRFTSPCPNCGRLTPRLLADQKAGGFQAVLDGNANVAKWFAELQRTSADDELVIWIALHEPEHSLEVFADVDAKIGPARVQVVNVADIERRLEESKGERFGDRRALRA
jgi:hypothetical protein